MQAARAGVAEDRRAEFEARGWLVLRGVVSAPDLAELNRIFDEVMAPYLVPGGDSSGVRLHPNACQAHSAILQHLHDGVAEIACHLLGAPSIRLLQDALLLKHPAMAGGSIALHQDYTYTGFLDPPSIVSVGLALNDASAESGCLHVVDASHAWGPVGGLRIFAGELQKDIHSMLSAAERDAVSRSTIPLEVRAGDVTIHHCLTLHGSDENRSRIPRKTIVTHLFSGACRLVRDRLPQIDPDPFATDEQGHLTAPMFPTLYAMDPGHVGRQSEAAPA